MDNDKLKQFIFPIILLFVTVIGTVSLFPKCMNNVQECIAAKQLTEDLNSQVEEKTAQLEELKRRKAQEAENERKQAAAIAKPFYRPIMDGLDTEAVIAGEFAEILQLIRANRIRVRSMKTDANPSDDEFVKGAANRYDVARLTLEMVGDYTSYGNFLKEMYKHEHFLDIQTVEIVSYRKNKRILLINFKVKLYAQK